MATQASWHCKGDNAGHLPSSDSPEPMTTAPGPRVRPHPLRASRRGRGGRTWKPKQMVGMTLNMEAQEEAL